MTFNLSGPFTVRAGGALGGSGTNSRPIPTLPRRMSEAERRQMAVRLRRDGWSYHRIAQTLDMRYSLVAAVADGDTAPPAPAAPSAPTPAVRPAPAATQRPETAPASGDVARKLDGLLDAVAKQGEAITRLEASIPHAIETAHDTLLEKLLAAVKTLFERIVPGRQGPAGDDANREPT